MSPHNVWWNHYQKATDSINKFNGLHEKVVAACDEIVKRGKADVETYTLMAQSHSNLGNIEKSIEVYSNIIRLDAGNSAAGGL